MTERLVKRYCTKPVVIEVVQFTHENKDRVFNWVTCNCYAGHDINGDGNPVLDIETSNGISRAKIGYYIIKDANGGFTICNPEVFHKLYEEVDNEQE